MVPDMPRTSLRDTQRETALRNIGRQRDFFVAASALHATGVPVIALKGVHLLSHAYRDLSVRAMTDIDLLVPAEQLERAAHAISALDYTPLRPFQVSDGPVPFSSQHLPPFLKAGASTIELHWQLVPPRFGLAIDERGLWRRAVTVRIAGLDVRVLSSEDLLLHLVAHAAYAHCCEETLRACCDIFQVVSTHAIDWTVLTARAVEWRIDRGTYLILRLSAELLSAAVPAEALAALKPPAFDERLLQAAMRPTCTEHVTPAMAGIWAGGDVREGARTLLQRVFLPRAQLADHYHLKRTSLRMPILYALRVWTMLKRWRTVLRLLRGEQGLRQRTVELAALQAFLGRRFE